MALTATDIQAMGLERETEQAMLDLLARVEAVEAASPEGDSGLMDAQLRFWNRISTQMLPLDTAGRIALWDSLAP